MYAFVYRCISIHTHTYIHTYIHTYHAQLVFACLFMVVGIYKMHMYTYIHVRNVCIRIYVHTSLFANLDFNISV